MTGEPGRNGYEWRLRDLERRMEALEREGSPATRVLKERLDGLNERTKAEDQAQDERITAVEKQVNQRIGNMEKTISWGARSGILVAATAAVGLFVWLIQGGGPPT